MKKSKKNKSMQVILAYSAAIAMGTISAESAHAGKTFPQKNRLDKNPTVNTAGRSTVYEATKASEPLTWQTPTPLGFHDNDGNPTGKSE